MLETIKKYLPDFFYIYRNSGTLYKVFTWIVIICVLLWIGSTVISYLKLNHQNWSYGPNLNYNRSDFALAVGRTGIYVIGGRASNAVLDTVEFFNINENSWKVHSKLNVPRSGASACVFNGNIYVFGGNDVSGNTLDSFEILDISSGNWSLQNGMPRYRTDHSCSEVSGNVYLIGGHPNRAINRKVDRFDPITSSWTDTYDTSPVERFLHSVEVIDNELYILNGTDVVSQRFQKYNPATKSWNRLNDSPQKTIGHASASYGKTLFLTGGISNTTAEKYIYKYSIERGSWSELPEMQVGRYAHKALAIERNKKHFLMVIGGNDNRGNYFNSTELMNIEK